MNSNFHSLKLACVTAIILLSSLGCGREENPLPAHQEFDFDFNEGIYGWTAGISDFPSDWDPGSLGFTFEHAALPPEVGVSGRALQISGNNHSDDLFMFMKRELTGLKPNHIYSVTFEITLASQYPTESVGIGGSPGNSVFLKAGGASHEPKVIDSENMFIMNIDKGDQSQSGSEMNILGTIGIKGDTFKYTLIEKNNLENPISIRTDNNGKMWAIVGTDSGFEGVTTLYYTKIFIKVRE
ncbi:MAG: hypothetical protein M3512_06610 [Bacteroidota bacterium]|nr:hypothetical protein [Bacteroidota bacterium]